MKLRALLDDLTPLEHAAYAVGMQLGTLALFGWLNFYAALAGGTCFAVGFFLGREHTQAETRWKQEWEPMTDLSGFDLRKWDRGSVLDLAWPVAACTAVVALALVYY